MNDAIERLRLNIDALAYGPYGIGRHNGRVVMVPLTVPGDEIEATIVGDKGNYAVGALAHIVAPSPMGRTASADITAASSWSRSRFPATRSKRPSSRDRKSTRLNSSHGYISY